MKQNNQPWWVSVAGAVSILPVAAFVEGSYQVRLAILGVQWVGLVVVVLYWSYNE